MHFICFRQSGHRYNSSCKLNKQKSNYKFLVPWYMYTFGLYATMRVIVVMRNLQLAIGNVIAGDLIR